MLEFVRRRERNSCCLVRFPELSSIIDGPSEKPAQRESDFVRQPDHRERRVMAEPPLPDAMYEPLVGDLAAIAAGDELVVQSVAVVLHGPIRNLRFHMCMGSAL